MSDQITHHVAGPQLVKYLDVQVVGIERLYYFIDWMEHKGVFAMRIIR